MAEASAAGAGSGATVAAHRFFCHFCKGEVSPKLPVRAQCPLRVALAWIPRPEVPEWVLSSPHTLEIGLPDAAAQCLWSLTPDPGRPGPGCSLTPAQPFSPPRTLHLPLTPSPFLTCPLHLFPSSASPLPCQLSSISLHSSSPCVLPTVTSPRIETLSAAASHRPLFPFPLFPRPSSPHTLSLMKPNSGLMRTASIRLSLGSEARKAEGGKVTGAEGDFARPWFPACCESENSSVLATRGLRSRFTMEGNGFRKKAGHVVSTGLFWLLGCQDLEHRPPAPPLPRSVS